MWIDSFPPNDMCVVFHVYSFKQLIFLHNSLCNLMRWLEKEKLLEHVEISMNEIGFESFYENHNEWI